LVAAQTKKNVFRVKQQKAKNNMDHMKKIGHIVKEETQWAAKSLATGVSTFAHNARGEAHNAHEHVKNHDISVSDAVKTFVTNRVNEGTIAVKSTAHRADYVAHVVDSEHHHQLSRAEEHDDTAHISHLP